MNASSPSSQLPVPMQKEKVVKEDGRFLYYYSFEEDTQVPLTGSPETKLEDTNV